MDMKRWNILLLLTVMISMVYGQDIQTLQREANQGKAYAQSVLGYHYYVGKDVLRNYVKAVYWFQKAAEQGDAKAQYNLGVCYYHGRSVAQNYEKAVEWFQKAADAGDVEAQNILGTCYEKGIGISQDVGKACFWYATAAQSGSQVASTNLDSLMKKLSTFTSPQEINELEQKARQGDANAQNLLGMKYYTGDGVALDFNKAAYWFLKSAEHGNVEAQANLGSCYFYGDGVDQSYEYAMQWWEKASAQGDSIAPYTIGKCYERGTGVSKDLEMMKSWWQKSAERGYDLAQHRLGYVYYEEGTQNVPGSYQKAVKYLTMASVSTDDYISGLACYLLSICYRHGRGVPRDIQKAEELQQKASEKGCSNARDLDEILKSLRDK